MSFHLPSHSREPVKDVPIPASEAEDVPSASAPLPDTSERVGAKRKRYITVFENGKKRKVVDTNSFHEDLQNAIEDLKKEIAKENWSQKGKFPPTIKPALAQLALKAIRLNEYDDYFFNLLPQLFPYNKFTMSVCLDRSPSYSADTFPIETREENDIRGTCGDSAGESRRTAGRAS